MRLSGAVIFAKDLRRMTAFYRDVLGLRVVEEAADFVRLDAGGELITLHAIPAAYAAAITIADPPAARSDTPLKLTFHTDADVRDEHARLASSGAQPRELHGSGFDALDPEGNVVRIAGT